MTLRTEELARLIAREVVERIRAHQGRSPLTGEPLPGSWPPPSVLHPAPDQVRRRLPVAVSARHVHLSQRDLEALFGRGARLTVFKWLSQVEQFAAAEQVTLIGPRGTLPRVRVLGPSRGHTQVEVSATDARLLGVAVPVRDSGDHRHTPGLTLEGPVGRITVSGGVIVAARHIHMHPDEAAQFGVADGQRVEVRTDGVRALVLENVLVRVNPAYRLEMHIDTDEANAAGLNDGDEVELISVRR